MPSKELERTIREYDRYIEQKGADEQVVEALVAGVNVAFHENNPDIEYAKALSARVKKIINQEIIKHTNGGNVDDLDAYCNEHHVKAEYLEQYYECVRCEAPYLFNSYLNYLERNRQEKDKFYKPRRRCFRKIGIIQALQDLEDDKLDVLSLSMPPSTGKAQPLYSKVLTPSGFVPMGSLKVGDKVIAANGNTAEILGIYPQGKKPIYEITMRDGAKCRCSDEHLWCVQTKDDRRKDRGDGSKHRIIELRDMIGRVKTKDGHNFYSIDSVGVIDFPHKDFIIHPYVMGVLLGDGYLGSTPHVATEDKELLDLLDRFLPDGYSMKHKDRCTYMVNGHEGNNAKAGSLITREIKRYGLFKHTSDEKFIPQDYLTASYEQRLWLLRGLMDTDGTADKRGICSFTSISRKLSEGVIELVQSLGGYASISEKEPFYTKNNVRINGHKAYNVSVSISDLEQIFGLTRKKERCTDITRRTNRFIESIEYIGEEECQCIYISDPSHLYVTDGYIVTHNTTLEKFFISWVIGRDLEGYSLFFSHSGDITRMFYDGILDITTNTTEYTWNQIFPKATLQATNAKAETINFGKYRPFASIQCTSVGAKNAGKVRCSKYLCCDDFIGGIEEALNKNILDKLWNIYTVDARQRKLDKCKELHLATRWSVHDIIGRLQLMYEGNDRARFIAYPDIDPATGKSNFDYDINGFTEQFFHEQELAMDEVSYRCLYKNEPIEREGLLYHNDELRTYFDLPSREPDAILGVCDTKSKGIDFMVMPVVYVFDDDYYLVDCICDDSSDYNLQEQRLAKMICEHNMQRCEFESNAGGDRLAFNVTERVKKQGGRCSITTKPTETNKETRIIVNSNWVKEHILFKDKSLYTRQSDYGVFINQLLSYSVSGKNKHDDVPDAMANFALFATRPERKVARIMKNFL